VCAIRGRLRAGALLAVAAWLASGTLYAREPGDPIKLAWTEGDVAGYTPIYGADGKEPIGVIEYVQRRKGDVLEARRVAYFQDGSSDEDVVEARVGRTLRTIGGRSIVRDTAGRPVVDLTIDVAGGRVTGFYGLGDDRKEVDERGEMPAGTYFGPLVNLVLKNFDANAEGGRLVFHTVVPTPGPRQLDMEVSREDQTGTTLRRGAHDITAVRYVMRPTVHPVLNPIVRMVAPDTSFYLTRSSPPAIARFAGPRNYAGQEIRIE
jgi:hypothetical protein